MSVLGNIEGDVHDWRVEYPDAIRPVNVRLGVQYGGIYAGGESEWQWFDYRADDPEFLAWVDALQAECPKP